jgi:hypothetical protein
MARHGLEERITYGTEIMKQPTAPAVEVKESSVNVKVREGMSYGTGSECACNNGSILLAHCDGP